MKEKEKPIRAGDKVDIPSNIGGYKSALGTKEKPVRARDKANIPSNAGGRMSAPVARKIPQRMCIACKEMKDKKQLIRILKSPEGEISLDFTGKKNGRGAYICPLEECINKCVKARLINKAFKCEVGKEVYDKILGEFQSAKR